MGRFILHSSGVIYMTWFSVSSIVAGVSAPLHLLPGGFCCILNCLALAHPHFPPLWLISCVSPVSHCLLLLLCLFNSSVWLPVQRSSLYSRLWLDLCFWFLSLPFSIVEVAEARQRLDPDSCVCGGNITPQMTLSLHLNLKYWVWCLTFLQIYLGRGIYDHCLSSNLNSVFLNASETHWASPSRCVFNLDKNPQWSYI